VKLVLGSLLSQKKAARLLDLRVRGLVGETIQQMGVKMKKKQGLHRTDAKSSLNMKSTGRRNPSTASKVWSQPGRASAAGQEDVVATGALSAVHVPGVADGPVIATSLSPDGAVDAGGSGATDTGFPAGNSAVVTAALSGEVAAEAGSSEIDDPDSAAASSGADAASTTDDAAANASAADKEEGVDTDAGSDAQVTDEADAHAAAAGYDFSLREKFDPDSSDGWSADDYVGAAWAYWGRSVESLLNVGRVCSRAQEDKHLNPAKLYEIKRKMPFQGSKL